MGACITTDEPNMDADAKNLAMTVSPGSDSCSSVSDRYLESDLRQNQSTNKDVNNRINRYMKEVEKKESEIIKLLLLGSGSSGKSTLFRQIECLHGEKKDDSDNLVRQFFLNFENIKSIIRLNCIKGLLKLLKQSDALSKAPYNVKNCTVNVDDTNIANAIKILVECKNVLEFGDKNSFDFTAAGETMQLLWQLDAIKETFKNRHYFSLPENIDYFLDKISVVMDESADGYKPTMEDVLNTRVKTTGIVERTYFIQQAQFDMFDVGGQRNERKKWISLFDSVTAVIFVAALNHYCSVLFEDETVNGMTESLELFEETINSKWFPPDATQWVLFLNKNDLFIKRLRDDKIPLTTCFDDFTGRIYSDSNAETFEKCYEEAVHFIRWKYISRIKDATSRENIVVHVTVATHKSNIQTVFKSVRKSIRQFNLNAAGMM